MRKYSSNVLLAGVVLVIFAVFAMPEVSPAASIEDRIENQQKRIAQGIKSGKLTKAEAKILRENLTRIKAERARLHRAGRLTKKERKRIEKLLNQNSSMIYKKKNNPVKRIKW